MKRFSGARHFEASVASSAVLACSLVLLGTSPDRASRAQIEVAVINCVQDISIAPSLRLVRYPNAGESSNDVPVQVWLAKPTAQPGVFSLSLTEEAGNYSIGASTPHCKTREPTEVPLYATHQRHVILVPSTSCCSVPESYPGSIAVSTPAGVWIGLYKISHGRSFRSQFGTADDGVTYFASVPPGSYEVVLLSSGAAACVPIVVPQAFHATQHYISFDAGTLAALFHAKYECTDAKSNHWHPQ